MEIYRASQTGLSCSLSMPLGGVLRPHTMAHPHQLLRVIITTCLFYTPSIAFTPTAIPAVPLRRRQRESPGSAASPKEEHAQNRQRSLMMATRHSPPFPSNGCSHPQTRQLPSTELRAANGGGASDRRGFLERVAAGTFAAGLSAAADVGGRPEGAGAFCGEPYPYWAYFMDFDEMLIPFKFEGYSGKLFARTVGNGKEQKKAQHNPLLIIPGGPGLPHDYLETLEGAAKDDRVVLLFDPIGTGNSSALPADMAANSPNLLGTTALVAQASAVVDHFKVNTFHLLGHGTGAAAALQLGKSMGMASPRPPGPELEAVLSVTLASPVLGENELAPDFLDALRAPYTKGGNEPPLCLETAMQSRNAEGFTGGLAAMKRERTSKNAAAAGPLSCPVLITYGKRDVIGDDTVARVKEGLLGGDAPVEVKRFEESGHLPHLDEREEYVSTMQNYVTFIDDAWAGKSGEKNKK